MSDSIVEDGHVYSIQFSPEHFIYKAHFPGQPVTPGVCILQIAKELLEQHSGLDLRISTVKNVKFLRVISPIETLSVTYSLQKIIREGKEIKCQATVSEGGNIFAKTSMVCTVAE